MQPEARQRAACVAVDLGAKAKAAGRGLGQRHDGVDGPVGIGGFGRCQHDRGNGPCAAQPCLGLGDGGGVVGRALRQVGDGPDALGAGAFSALDPERAKAQHRPGRDAHADAERARVVVRGHFLPVERGLRMALRAPAIDSRAGGVADQRAARGLAGRETVGQSGTGGQGRDLGPGKGEKRAGIDADLDARDGFGVAQGRDVGGFAPVDQHPDRRRVIAVFVHQPDQTAVFGPRRGHQVDRPRALGLLGGQHQRGRAQDGRQCIGRAGRDKLGRESGGLRIGGPGGCKCEAKRKDQARKTGQGSARQQRHTAQPGVDPVAQPACAAFAPVVHSYRLFFRCRIWRGSAQQRSRTCSAGAGAFRAGKGRFPPIRRLTRQVGRAREMLNL